MNPFEKHYSEDLEAIELQGVTFHVKLPSAGNKRFQRSVLSRIVKQNDEGEYETGDTSLEEMAEAQVDAFARTCIRKVDGWDDFTIEKLLAMPDACEDLWAAVAELTKEKEGEANATAKKLVTSSSGQPSGKEKASSMQDSKQAAG